jgi:glycosyltransferase involved in cell wall biosynthesis
MSLPDYVTLTVARNEEKIIQKTIDHLLQQKHKPIQMVLVNDGSTDRTGDIMDTYAKKYDLISVVHRKNRGFSALGTYLMADVYNDGFKILFQNDDWKYVMIAAADSFFPSNYAKDVLSFHNKLDKIGVFGGLPEGVSRSVGYCPGSGRFINRDILENMGEKYPRNYNWESSVFSEAWMMDYKTGHIPHIRFPRARAGGKGHKMNYFGWGRGMKDGGYHPLYVFLKTFVDIFRGKIEKAIKSFVGYFSHQTMQPIPERNKFIWNRQKARIVNDFRKLLRKIFRI